MRASHTWWRCHWPANAPHPIAPSHTGFPTKAAATSAGGELSQLVKNGTMGATLRSQGWHVAELELISVEVGSAAGQQPLMRTVLGAVFGAAAGAVLLAGITVAVRRVRRRRAMQLPPSPLVGGTGSPTGSYYHPGAGSSSGGGAGPFVALGSPRYDAHWRVQSPAALLSYTAGWQLAQGIGVPLSQGTGSPARSTSPASSSSPLPGSTQPGGSHTTSPIPPPAASPVTGGWVPRAPSPAVGWVAPPSPLGWGHIPQEAQQPVRPPLQQHQPPAQQRQPAAPAAYPSMPVTYASVPAAYPSLPQ